MIEQLLPGFKIGSIFKVEFIYFILFELIHFDNVSPDFRPNVQFPIFGYFTATSRVGYKFTGQPLDDSSTKFVELEY